MIIHFNQIGTFLNTRIAGASVREKVVSAFNRHSFPDKITFDFSGVETISKSFADECFGKLILNFDFNKIKHRTTFVNTSPFIKTVIANAFQERLEEKEEYCA